MTRTQTKRVTIDIRRRRGARRLAALLDDGWTVVSEHKRGILQWKPGQVDYVLTRERQDRRAQ